MGKTLAEATDVTQLTSHTYTSVFPDEWCIGAVPHGGFVTASFLKVAEAHFKGTLSAQNQPNSIALHLDFLRRTQAGNALFTVKDTKLGRQTSVIHVTLSQDGREEVVGYITQSNVSVEAGVTFKTNYVPHPTPLRVDLARLSNDQDEHWARQHAMPFAGFRKATQKTQFHFPRNGQGENSMADEWIRLDNGEKWTNSSLGYVCDMWPMPVEAFANAANPYDVKHKEGAPIPAKFWYPTVLLNLDFKKSIPEEGVEWLFVRVAAKQIKNGRMDLEVVIMDAEGDIVALSHHVALVLSSDRNIAERKSAKI